MSTLVLVLATAMTLPASGPEKVSGEMEQGLDLRGEWEGLCCGFSGSIGVVEGKEGLFTATSEGFILVLHADHIADESSGRCSVMVGPKEEWLGIYKQDSNRVAISFRKSNQGYLQSLTAGNGQCLLILHRVKPRK